MHIYAYIFRTKDIIDFFMHDYTHTHTHAYIYIHLFTVHGGGKVHQEAHQKVQQNITQFQKK